MALRCASGLARALALVLGVSAVIEIGLSAVIEIRVSPPGTGVYVHWLAVGELAVEPPLRFNGLLAGGESLL